jgi:hypothetical protein
VEEVVEARNSVGTPCATSPPCERSDGGGTQHRVHAGGAGALDSHCLAKHEQRPLHNEG